MLKELIYLLKYLIDNIKFIVKECYGKLIIKFLCFYENVIKDFYLEFFEENIYEIFN